MLFRPFLLSALVTLAIARPSPSSLKTIASSATGSKSSIKSPSQKLAEKNNSPSVASILDSPAITQGVSQVESLSANLPQGQDTDPGLQYSQEVVPQQPDKVAPVVVKEVQAAPSSVQNEVVKPAVRIPVEEPVAAAPIQPVDVVQDAAIRPDVVPIQPVDAVQDAPIRPVVPIQPVDVVQDAPVRPVVVPIQPVDVVQDAPIRPVVVPIQPVDVVQDAPIQPVVVPIQPVDVVQDAPVRPVVVSVQPSIAHVMHNPVQPQEASVQAVGVVHEPANVPIKPQVTEDVSKTPVIVEDSARVEPSLHNSVLIEETLSEQPIPHKSLLTSEVVQPQKVSQVQPAPVEIVDPKIPASNVAKIEDPVSFDQTVSKPVDSPIVSTFDNKPVDLIVETLPMGKSISTV